MTPTTTDAVAVENVRSTPLESQDDDLDKTYRLQDHWKCLAACTMVSMCPFQYGMLKPSVVLSRLSLGAIVDVPTQRRRPRA